ncbi:MAG: carboxypeptidase M32 [Candidatus Asgardarchaeum californiense]|nr:MAG: carboxypeptidase M32 [Candidatus Asgardarchaeum californiense]
MKESLDFIYKEQRELSLLGGISALLGWDQMTYMPYKGTQERSKQLALISRLSHERFISDRLYKHVKKLSNQKVFEKLDESHKIVVKRLKKDIEKARKVPSEFVEKLSKTTTIAYAAWQKARNENDFSLFASHLEKIVELEKQYCEFIGLPGHPYNNLIDDYEEGMTVAKLEKEFSYLKSQLIKILDKIKTSKIYITQQKFDKTFDIEKQKKICYIIMNKMMLPKERARLDVSTHPFTTAIGDDDVRITTNYNRNNTLFSFFSTVHEAGHALYELGLPKGKFKYTVISDAPSLGLHESQSRFWENMIAKNMHFWNYFYATFRKIASTQMSDVSIEQWYLHINQVKPSLIRIEADELTYCLHVILRFDIELDLINEKINVKELPNIWNEKMDKLLGITPTSNRDGALQDMHWSNGNFGYFPTYAIGSIYAAQLFKKISQDNINTYEEIEQGNFVNILKWLRKNIHKYGRSMTAEEIMKNACGEGLNSRIFVKYLKDKYYSIYDV